MPSCVNGAKKPFAPRFCTLAKGFTLFGIGGFEFFLIVVFGFLIVGPDRLPAIAKTIGQAIGKFRSAQDQMNKVIKTEVYDPKSDEPFKNPLEVIEKMGSSSGSNASEGSGSSDDSASASAGSKAAASSASAGRRESFSERKARYEQERAAKHAEEAKKKAEEQRAANAAKDAPKAAAKPATEAASGAASASSTASASSAQASASAATAEKGE